MHRRPEGDAVRLDEALLHSEAAERNGGPILDALRRVLPTRGVALEVASGSGQHATRFAAAVPGLTFVPSDPDPSARASVDARAALSGLPNLRTPALALDAASDAPWPLGAADAVLCVNMAHIAPWAATEGLVRGAARVLPPGGPLVLYGPFRVGGAHTAPSNAAFDEDLRARDPAWGVRDLEAVAEAAAARGFLPPEVVPMPANNLLVVFRREAGDGVQVTCGVVAGSAWAGSDRGDDPQ